MLRVVRYGSTEVLIDLRTVKCDFVRRRLCVDLRVFFGSLELLRFGCGRCTLRGPVMGGEKISEEMVT